MKACRKARLLLLYWASPSSDIVLHYGLQESDIQMSDANQRDCTLRRVLSSQFKLGFA